MTEAGGAIRHGPLFFWFCAVAIGVAWGGSQLLSKIAISTGHDPAGVTLIETMIAGSVTLGVCLLSGRRVPVSRRALGYYIACGVFGWSLPGVLNYTALSQLPVGIVSILVATVPMLTMALGWALGREKVGGMRVLGILLGAGAVAMIALPDTAVPGVDQAVWMLLSLGAAACYAVENLIIDMASPPKTDAVTLMAGMSWAAAALLLPIVWMREGWVDLTPLGPPEQAILGVGVVHLICYTGFVWLVKSAGPVFAAQVGYVVTISAVLWGMAMLGERHTSLVWVAFVVMLAGMALVQPRQDAETTLSKAPAP